MDIFLSIATVLLPLAYLLVASAYGVVFYSSHPRAKAWSTPALRATIAFHALYLAALVARWHQFPAATVAQALSVMAFAVAIVYAVVEWHGRERSTGLWLVGLVFFFQLLSALLGRPEPPDLARFKEVYIGVHILLALLGYTGFAVAAGYAFLFLQLYRELKAGRFSTFFGKLPPLEILERMMLGAVTLGFASLTGAVVSGAFWADRLFHGAWLRDPKILSTLAIWLLYALVLLMRRLRRWQGRETAIACLAGLGGILFSLVAVNFFFTDFHGFL